jgi:ribose 5-phosphate isomerase RpiB
MAVLHMVADNDGESFGHATIGARETGAGLNLGANDVKGVQAGYVDGVPSLDLRDATEAAVFHAP